MAGVLKITDGTTTINLLDNTGLHLARGGWRPAVAQEDENGAYLPMIEVVSCVWTETDDDSRAETIKTIKRLDRKAREHWRKRKINEYVWLEASTHSETNTRYGAIRSIDIKELDSEHWGPDGIVDLKLVITHELWWHIAPNGAAATVVDGVTIENKADSSNDNYVEISAANAKGDAPALAIIELDNVTDRHYITLRREDDLGDFITYLNWADHEKGGSGFTTNADASLPGGEYGRLGGTTDANYAQFVFPANLAAFLGQYLVYALCRTNTATETALRYGFALLNTSAPQQYGEGVVKWDGATTSWFAHYLGKISLLQDGTPQGASAPADATISVQFDKSVSCNADLAGVALVQVNQGIFFAGQPSQGDKKIIDGRAERVYSQETTGEIARQSVPYQGQFIQIEPGETQRLYFFGAAFDVPVFPGWDATDTYTVTVKLIYRYTSLRGND